MESRRPIHFMGSSFTESWAIMAAVMRMTEQPEPRGSSPSLERDTPSGPKDRELRVRALVRSDES